MRKIVVALGGFALGLLATWLSAYVMSHAHNLPNFKPAYSGGCSDGEHCDPNNAYWLLAMLLLPSVPCSVAAYLASARAWSWRKSVTVVGLTVLVNMLFIGSSYVI